MTNPDLYEVLGVGRDADTASIRGAYRARAKKAHPDQGGTDEAFNQLTIAHDVLTNDERRARYDATGQWDMGDPDDPDARAFSIIGEALMGVVQGDGDPMCVDLVAHVTQALGKQIAEFKQKLGPQERALDRTRNMKGRFKNRKKEANRINKMLDWQIRALEEPIAKLKGHIADFERAKELIADYDFEADTPPLREPTRQGFVHFGGSRSTASFGW